VLPIFLAQTQQLLPDHEDAASSERRPTKALLLQQQRER
jgi:hypothetical protein